jgi:uncharacterized protein (DUF736 family)
MATEVVTFSDRNRLLLVFAELAAYGISAEVGLAGVRDARDDVDGAPRFGLRRSGFDVAAGWRGPLLVGRGG